MELTIQRAMEGDASAQRDIARQSLSDTLQLVTIQQELIADIWDEVMAERKVLRDRLAAALWELRRAKRTIAKMRYAPLSREDIAWGVKWARDHGYGRLDDDQVTWRLSELERKMATWEGD